ncbi:MAG: hypothetical protein J6O01_08450, partial [Bacteroidales bacterium]|nr:hypothetical protein [Bacteroidales bacterium]
MGGCAQWAKNVTIAHADRSLTRLHGRYVFPLNDKSFFTGVILPGDSREILGKSSENPRKIFGMAAPCMSDRALFEKQRDFF